MSKPKWRKYKGGWKRGVLEVVQSYGLWEARVDGSCYCYCDTPEEAMSDADKWWERTRMKMEGK